MAIQDLEGEALRAERVIIAARGQIGIPSGTKDNDKSRRNGLLMTTQN
jgi:hypothetical protein